MSGNSIEEKLEETQRTLKDLDSSIEALLKFQQRIAAGLHEGVCDAQDLEWVTEEVTAKQRERQELHESYSRSKKFYDTSLQQLLQILSRRNELIEEADSHSHVFGCSPGLLRKFAQKRALLMRMIEQTKKEFDPNSGALLPNRT